MSERRFNEAEVAAIFQQATEAQQQVNRQLPSGEGLTLSELRDIGREIGVSTDLVDHAAHTIERAGTPATRHFIGLPIGVGRTVELERKLSNEEWEQLVVDLRETFNARGNLRGEGSLRQWTNGNLQALLEPTESGHRVRLRTTKGDARGMMVGGLAMAATGAAGLIAALAAGTVVDAGMLSSLGFVAASGAAMFGFGAAGLSRWARTREQQMREVAGRLAGRIAKSSGRLPD